MIKDIFREFYMLSYYRDEAGFPELQFKDSTISPSRYIIFRQSEEGYYIHYLTCGNTLYIPFPWVKLISSLSVYAYDRITHNPVTPKDNTEWMCHYLLFLFNRLNTLDVIGDRTETEITQTLERMVAIGTKNFRDWVLKDFNLSLPPLEFRFLEDTIKI